MKIQEVQRKPRKVVRMSIKTFKETSVWMKKNNISPQAVFDKAIEELKNQKGQKK